MIEVRISALDLVSTPHGDLGALAIRKLVAAGMPEDGMERGTITEWPMDLLGLILVRWTENPDA